LHEGGVEVQMISALTLKLVQSIVREDDVRPQRSSNDRGAPPVSDDGLFSE